MRRENSSQNLHYNDFSPNNKYRQRVCPQSDPKNSKLKTAVGQDPPDASASCLIAGLASLYHVLILDQIDVTTIQLSGVPAVVLEVLSVLGILVFNSVLADFGQEEESEESREDAERRGNVEGILNRLDCILSSCGLNVREDIVSDECTDLADGGSCTVVAATVNFMSAKFKHGCWTKS